MSSFLRPHLLAGQVIPALPLALDKRRAWDERHQRALVRYYADAGAGGIAVGVHSTQFAIRDPSIGLYAPVLALAAEAARDWLRSNSSSAADGRPVTRRAGSPSDARSRRAVQTARPAPRPFVLIAGLCGRTAQARREARTAVRLGYHAGLLSLGAWANDAETKILRHAQAVAREIPLIGFYLQPAVGGRVFSYRFWRAFAEIPELVAIKVAPFNRYRTLDVVRAVLESGRDDVALYTGNDDNIIVDLLTPFSFAGRTRHIDGGLLGQWGVGTHAAVQLFAAVQAARSKPPLAPDWLTRNAALTDANAAIFDAANGFRGCLPGIHEVLRRQGLLATTACLDPHEQLSPGQAREITRVFTAYPWLSDDTFVARHRARWLE